MAEESEDVELADDLDKDNDDNIDQDEISVDKCNTTPSA